MSTAIVTGFVAWLVALLGSVAHDVATIDADPIRFCYAIEAGTPAASNGVGVIDQPWSCYLEADRPKGQAPVWVGPQSEVNAASGWMPFRDVNGHAGCEIKVGDTSLIRCADGYRTES